MEKNILLILGHPSEKSFCNALLDSYRSGAESTGAVCRIIYVSKLAFDVNLQDGYKTGETMQLEDDPLTAQVLIQWADHVVMAYPNWWGFAFKHQSSKIFPEKLLAGKSLRLLVTMDTPKWWFYLIYRASQYQILKHIVFGYVGFTPIRFSTFGFMRKSTAERRIKWLQKIRLKGENFQ